MKKACVIGYPIEHSLSPIIHNYWLEKNSIEGLYEKVEVKPEELEDFILNLKNNGYQGCNITVPHKEEAWKIIDKHFGWDGDDDGKTSLPSTVAKYMKAVNTIVIDDDGKYIATNTDFLGFARNLIENQPEYDYRNAICLVLGAGGAAKAVSFALASMGVYQIVIANRTEEKSFEIKDMITKNFGYDEDRFDVVPWDKRNEVVKHCNFIVNTTNLGMKGQGKLDMDISNMPEGSLVTDIVYNPLETKLLDDAKKHGYLVVDGIGMLLHQAAPGFEGWFGKNPVVDSELKKMVLNKLPK
jgi:shikimate dehydrogenase